MKDRPARPHPKNVRPVRSIDQEYATGLAIGALTFLAAEPERLDRFLSLAGLDHGSLRSAAAEPGFLSGVLEHVCSDEPLLLAFAAENGHDPAEVAAAGALLTNPGGWSEP